jgi:hypothetical protein
MNKKIFIAGGILGAIAAAAGGVAVWLKRRAAAKPKPPEID